MILLSVGILNFEHLDNEQLGETFRSADVEAVIACIIKKGVILFGNNAFNFG